MESTTVQSPKIKLLESKKRLQKVAPSKSVKSQFDDLQERIRGYFKLQDTYSGLSSPESEYKDKLHTQCKTKWAELTKFTSKMAESVGGHANLLGQCLGELDLEVLRERDKHKMPLLMPIWWNGSKTYMHLEFSFRRPTSSAVTLSLDYDLEKVAGFADAFIERVKQCFSRGLTLSIKLSRSDGLLLEYYGDLLINLLHEKSVDEQIAAQKDAVLTFELEPKLAGVIAPEHREKVREAKALAEILPGACPLVLITDVRGIKWKKSVHEVQKVHQENYCPIVGLLYGGKLFHYYDFDLTPAEEAMLFAGKGE